jgi:antitoxin (DNA-binding transcriptional repressor) of toxin-antitoxin stability system
LLPEAPDFAVLFSVCAVYGRIASTTNPRSQVMSSVTLEEAQGRLPQLLEQLQPGEAITITEHGQPLAQVKKLERTSWPCKAGGARGKIHIAPDFDAPLDDFKEYME